MPIDTKATGELLGALLKGFLLGDEAVTGAVEKEPPMPVKPEPPIPETYMPVQPMEAIPNDDPRAKPPSEPPLPSGVTASQVTYARLIRTHKGFAQEPVQWEALERAFKAHNQAGLSITECLLLVAVLRGMLIRTYGVSSEAVDYTLDVALDVVDDLSGNAPTPG